MSRRKGSADRAGQHPRRLRRRGAIAFLVGLWAVIAACGLIWLAQPGIEPELVAVAASENTIGAPTAPVEVEIWADYQCPFCGRFARGAERQLADTLVAAGQVKLVLRNYAFLGQESFWAAEAAECAQEQDALWIYHNKLYTQQSGENRGAFSRPNLKRYAADVGLDSGSFGACLDSGRYAAKVQEETDLGQQKGVRATPTLFVNGHRVQGAVSFEDLRQMIESALVEVAQ
jgi:protein-disulfide isomerase